MFSGGCACGRHRFEARSAPVWTAFCHCADCRRATGAPVTLWCGFAASDMAWSASPTLRPSRSGVFRGFCVQCGTPLTYVDDSIPGGEVYVAAGAFDDPAGLAPQAHAFWSARLPYMRFDDGLPRHDTVSRVRRAQPVPTAN